MRTRKNLYQMLYALAAAFVCLLIYKLLGKPITGLFSNDYIGSFTAQLFFAVIVTIAVFLLKRTDIYHSESACMKTGWLSAGLMFFIILFYLVIGAFSFVTVTASWWEILLVAGQAFLVGYCEEALFRGLIQKSLHQYIGEDTRGKVIACIVLSGLIFGLAHLSNVTVVSFGAAAIQAAVTAVTGIYFSAIFYRCGKNMWYIAFIHGLYDLAGFIAGGRLSGNPITPINENVTQYGWYVVLFWFVIYGLAAAVVLRPKKLDPLLRR